MTHRTTDQFWDRYHGLPLRVRRRADKAFELIKANPSHPLLQFKKVGAFWSARIDLSHRALAVREDEDCTWVWIGSHDAYDEMINR